MHTMLLEEPLFQPQYSFLGIVIAALLLIAGFVLVFKYWAVPHIQRRAKGFNVAGELKKLDKHSYKLIKKMYFENFRTKRYVANVIVSNYGVFIVNARFELGKIFQNDDGKLFIEKEGVKHALGDFEDDNFKAFSKMKKLSGQFNGVPLYSIVAFPDTSEIHATSEKGFVGSLKDVVPYILSKKDNRINDEKRDDMYAILCRENDKNSR